jgi:hypothetical protein
MKEAAKAARERKKQEKVDEKALEVGLTTRSKCKAVEGVDKENR